MLRYGLMNDQNYSATHTTEKCDLTDRTDRKRAATRDRMRRLRERKGAAVGTSISLPPAVHDAATKLLRMSRRGGGATSKARAYLTGVMMVACAGQSALAKARATEFTALKNYLADLDDTCD